MADIPGILIIDGANWSHQLEGDRLRIDYNGLVFRLQRITGIKIVAFSYYTAFRTNEDLNRRWKFLEYLKNMGWQVQAMPATLGADGRWRDKEVDVAIALDAYEEVRSGSVGAVLIGSGDADFAALFRRLPEEVPRWAVGFRASMSPALQQVARVLLIEDLGVLREAPPALRGSVPEEFSAGDSQVTEKERKARQVRSGK